MATDLSVTLKWVLAISLIVYVMVMFGVCLWAHKRVKDVEDYVVAGRRLPLSLAWATLLATWFGASTMLTQAGEVAREGVRQAALDPIGGGLCLIIAGTFYARPLWEMNLLTSSDFFRIKFGEKAEIMSALIMIPSFFGWIAAQFVAFAHILDYFFGIPFVLGVLLVAIVGTSYTLLGGMWSVTLTDAIQITLIIIGLILLTFKVFAAMGGGDFSHGLTSVLAHVEQVSPEKLVWIPHESASQFWGWASILCAGALGNLPGQDLMQRVFASKSATVARQACWVAGGAYLALGMLPVLLGLAAASHFGSNNEDSVIPALAHVFLDPVYTIIFVLVLLSVVLATIDSAILAPATVMAQNLLIKVKWIKISPLDLNRLCVLFVATCSLIMALTQSRAFSLLENAYSMTMVGLFVPLTLGLFLKPKSGWPAIAAMIVGPGLWLPQYIAGWTYFLQGFEPIGSIGLSLSLSCTGAALTAYLILHYLLKSPVTAD